MFGNNCFGGGGCCWIIIILILICCCCGNGFGGHCGCDHDRCDKDCCC